jgi:hypothetical protein
MYNGQAYTPEHLPSGCFYHRDIFALFGGYELRSKLLMGHRQLF